MTKIAAAVANPCPECPFNRRVKPGTLGGSPVSTYLGQIVGPFAIACHMHIDFQDAAWRDATTYAGTPQCAGAAVMRANIGVDVLMPERLPRAQSNRVAVFADLAEFVVHHTSQLGSVEHVRRMLATPGVLPSLLNVQIHRARLGMKP